MSEWRIPSEEMPPEGIVVLVTVTDGDHEAVQMAYQIGGEWKDLVSNETVVAWMPMPDPYRSVTYRLEVWKYGTMVDFKTTNVLSWLQDYYDHYWRWAEADGDCFCELFVNGQKLDVEETDKYLEGRFDY